MAGTLLHVTLADRAAVALRDHEARAVILRHPHDFALGAVLVDLPYFARLHRTALALALGRPLRYHPFGGELHRRSPAGLLLALLERSRTGADRALAFGALTHHAVDLVFHPEIERRLAAAKHGSPDPDGLHKRLEDEIDLHCHFHLLGTSGVGTAHARRALRLEPSPGWNALVRGAVAEIHGSAPQAEEWEEWRSQLALYGLASSFPLAPWLKMLPADDPELLARSVALAEESIQAAVEYMEAGAGYLRGALAREGFLSAVPDRNALDGGCATRGVRIS
jgi:hypothetical protein